MWFIAVFITIFLNFASIRVTAQSLDAELPHSQRTLAVWFLEKPPLITFYSKKSLKSSIVMEVNGYGLSSGGKMICPWTTRPRKKGYKIKWFPGEEIYLGKDRSCLDGYPLYSGTDKKGLDGVDTYIAVEGADSNWAEILYKQKKIYTPLNNSTVELRYLESAKELEDNERAAVENFLKANKDYVEFLETLNQCLSEEDFRRCLNNLKDEQFEEHSYLTCASKASLNRNRSKNADCDENERAILVEMDLLAELRKCSSRKGFPYIDGFGRSEGDIGECHFHRVNGEWKLMKLTRLP